MYIDCKPFTPLKEHLAEKLDPEATQRHLQSRGDDFTPGGVHMQETTPPATGVTPSFPIKHGPNPFQNQKNNEGNKIIKHPTYKGFTFCGSPESVLSFICL